jgi:Ankyrin repeats (3 copies)
MLKAPLVFTVLVLSLVAWPRAALARDPSAATVQAAADPDGLTPLMRAAARGDAAQVNTLLASGANPNVSTPAQRVTALMCAAYFGHAPVIKALVARGARIELKDAQGAAAVDWAALGDHPELEKTLTGPGVALNPFINATMPIWLMDKAAGQ